VRAHVEGLIDFRLLKLDLTPADLEHFAKMGTSRSGKHAPEMLREVLRELLKSPEINCINYFEDFVETMERRRELLLTSPEQHVFFLWDAENLAIPRGLTAFDCARAIFTFLTEMELSLPAPIGQTRVQCAHIPSKRTLSGM
jgi:hypothetical protein